MTNEAKDARRAILATDNRPEYAKHLQQMIGNLAKSKQQVVLAVLDSYGIDPQLYDKSNKVVGGELMKAAAAEIEVSENMKQMASDYEPLSREVALQRLEEIELKKMEFMAGVIIASKMGQFPPNQMGLGAEMSKYQAIDFVNKENGVEEVDLVIAFNKYNLEDSEEFKVIMQKAQAHLQVKANEAMAMIQRVNQMRQSGGPPGGMPGMPGGAPQ